MSESQSLNDESVSTDDEIQFGSPVADRVYALLASAVETLDAELLDVEWTGGTLRLAIDAEGGVTTERLAQVNRLVSPMLDQHDPVPGRYVLEVSSPGVERPLRRADHFRRAIGENVVVKLETWSEVRRVRGELVAADEETVTVEAVETDGVNLPDSETFTIAYGDIAKARTHFDWGPTPKKGGKNNNSSNKSGKNKKSGKKKSGR